MFIEQQNFSGQFSEIAFLASDLFGALSPAAQDSLRAVTLDKEFAKDETIFADGEPTSGVYILRIGEAQILYRGDRKVHLIKPDEILGLTETVANLPFESSVKTLSACHFEFISRAAFLAFLGDEPETCFRLLRMLGANLHKLYRFFHETGKNN